MIINQLSRYTNWYKPKQIILSKEVDFFLKSMYPSVNWKNVRFYDGLPWFILSSKATAIALPANFSFRNINIHLTNFNENSIEEIGILVHESFHVWQYTAIGISGIGFIRLFMIKYFGFWATYGYKNNPMEIEAYKHETEFCSSISKYLIQNNLRFSKEELPIFLTKNSNLVKSQNNSKYNPGILKFLVGLFLVLVIEIFMPISEILLYVVYVIFSVTLNFSTAIIKRY